jgi:hypothetical protein
VWRKQILNQDKLDLVDIIIVVVVVVVWTISSVAVSCVKKSNRNEVERIQKTNES